MDMRSRSKPAPLLPPKSPVDGKLPTRQPGKSVSASAPVVNNSSGGATSSAPLDGTVVVNFKPGSAGPRVVVVTGKTQRAHLVQDQRRQIYALNAALAAHEQTQFEAFVAAQEGRPLEDEPYAPGDASDSECG
jgi:hypothetical protein